MDNTSKYTTTRIWKRTLKTFKFIAILTDQSMVKVMDELAQKELKRLTKDGEQERSVDGENSAAISE